MITSVLILKKIKKLSNTHSCPNNNSDVLKVLSHSEEICFYLEFHNIEECCDRSEEFGDIHFCDNFSNFQNADIKI